MFLEECQCLVFQATVCRFVFSRETKKEHRLSVLERPGIPETYEGTKPRSLSALSVSAHEICEVLHYRAPGCFGRVQMEDLSQGAGFQENLQEKHRKQAVFL